MFGQDDRPGPLGYLFGYAPLAAGLAYGGYRGYKALAGNTGPLGAIRSAFIDTGKEHIRGATAAGRATIEAMIRQSQVAAARIAGPFPLIPVGVTAGDPAYLKAVSGVYSSFLLRAGSGLGKAELGRALAEGLGMAKAALAQGARPEEYKRALEHMMGRLQRFPGGEVQEALQKAWGRRGTRWQEMVLPTEGALFVPPRVTPISPGAPVTAELQKIARRLGPAGGARNLEVSKVQAALRGEAASFFKIQIGEEGRGFHFYLPERVNSNLLLTNEGSLFEAASFLRQTKRGYRAISAGSRQYNIAKRVVELAETGDISGARRLWTEEHELLRSFSRFHRAASTRGERLQDFLWRNTAFPEEAFSLGGRPLPKERLLELLAEGGPLKEWRSPGELVRGGGLTRALLPRWYTGTESMEWASRPYQGLREVAYVPPPGREQFIERRWGMSIKDGNVVLNSNIPAGHGAMRFFHRFIPVNPGKHWETELVGELGHIAPHQMQLHFFGGTEGVAAETAKLFERYGLAEGQGNLLMRARWKNLLAMETTHTYRISTIAPYSSRIAEFQEGRPVLLTNGSVRRGAGRGTLLGYSREGTEVWSSDLGHVKEQLVGVRQEGAELVLEARQVRNAIEGSKLFAGPAGGTKTTISFQQTQVIRDLAREALFGLPEEQLSNAQKAFLRDIDAVTATSAVRSQGLYGIERNMTATLKYLAGQKFTDIRKAPDSAKQFLRARNPLQWLTEHVGSLPAGLAGTAEELTRFRSWSEGAMKFANEIGISTNPLFGMVFASSIGPGGRFTTEARAAIMSAVGPKLTTEQAEQIIAVASRGVGPSWEALNMADDPWMQKARRARLETRTLEQIQNAAWKVGGHELTEGIFRDLMTGAHVADPAKVRAASAISLMYQSAIDKAKIRAFGTVPQLEFAAAGLGEVSAEEWFRGEGALVRLPEAARKRAGMGEFLYVPGEKAVGTDLAVQERTFTGMGEFRTRTGELGKQHYRQFIDDEFRNLATVFAGQDEAAQVNALNHLKDRISMFHKQAQTDLLTAELGPGSGYVQAQTYPIGMSEEVSGRLLGPGFLKSRQGKFQTERQVFFSRVEAGRMMQGIDPAQFQEIYGISKEQFLRGEGAVFGYTWRNPTVMHTSFQPAEFWVHRGISGKESPRAIVFQKPTDVRFRGETFRLDTGIPAGMLLDSDADRIHYKMIADKALVSRMQGGKAAWTALERGYQQTVLTRQIYAKVMGKRMMEVAKATMNEQEAKRVGARAAGAVKMHIAKTPGPISKVLEEMSFAISTGGGAMEPELLGMANALSVGIEETATIKAKKAAIATRTVAGRALSVADELVEAKREGWGNFLSSVHDLLLGGRAEEPLSYEILEGGGTRTVTLPTQERLFTYMGEKLNEYAGSEREAVWKTLGQVGGDVPAAVKEEAWRLIARGEVADPKAALLKALGTLEGFAGESFTTSTTIAGTNLQTIAKGAGKLWGTTTKHIPGPMLAGLLGSAALFTVMGGPGYAAKPLDTGEEVDPRILQAIQQGDILHGMSQTQEPHIPPGDLLPRGGGPTPPNRFVTPTAAVMPMSTNARIRLEQDMDKIDYREVSREMRARFPQANITSRLNDRRRPLTPNDLYRNEE